MNVKELIDKHVLSLTLLSQIIRQPNIHIYDEVEDYRLGFVDGYMRCFHQSIAERISVAEINNLLKKHKERIVPPKVKASLATKSKKRNAKINSSQNNITKPKKKKRKKGRIWTISVPMGGMTNRRGKRKRVNS